MMESRDVRNRQWKTYLMVIIFSDDDDDDNAAFYGLLADNKYCAYKVYVYKSYQKLYTYFSGSSNEGK